MTIRDPLLQEVLDTAIFPALAALPPKFYSPAALHLQLAIGLQESKLAHRWQVLNGGGKGPFRRLIAIEIGASELTVWESGQNLGELLAMVAMGEMDSFVEEDVIQGVIRGELEAI